MFRGAFYKSDVAQAAFCSSILLNMLDCLLDVSYHGVCALQGATEVQTSFLAAFTTTFLLTLASSSLAFLTLAITRSFTILAFAFVLRPLTILTLVPPAAAVVATTLKTENLWPCRILPLIASRLR